LTQHQADRRIQNNRSKTALDLARDKGYQDMIRLLDEDAGIED
jgi:hypothetical protein